jgi:hypothetical protein
MAKKSRRARRRAPNVAQPVRVSRLSQPPAAEAAAGDVDFAVEYHYVIEDLKRIGITAVALLILLIVLALLLT